MPTKINAAWLGDPFAQKVMTLLNQGSNSAYFVGGCVRNALLGLPATDLDVATNLHPSAVMRFAQDEEIKAVPTGLDHGTVTLVEGLSTIEVTTFRTDVETDGRHAKIAFSDTMEEDAARRDFTINALYCDPSGRIFDPVDGLPDIAKRRIRFINNPHDRIKEDYLRILRFFRFHAHYADPEGGFEQDALAAIAELADGLEQISRERIGMETRKLLAATDPTTAVAAMEKTGVLRLILPGAQIDTLGPVIHFEEHLNLPPNWLRRLASMGQENWTKALRLSNKEKKTLADIRNGLSSDISISEAAYRKGPEIAYAIALIRHASLQTPPPPVFNTQIETARNARFPVQASDLELTGKALGEALNKLEKTWIASEFKLTKEDLLK